MRMNTAIRVTAGALFLVLGMGCGPGTDSGSEGVVTTPAATRMDSLNMPAAAVAAMENAKGAAFAPLFFACPRYLSYEPLGFDEYGNRTTDWYGPVTDLLDVDKPTTRSYGTTVVLFCGSTMSNRDSLSVRKTLPTGYSSCTTSPVGQVDAWFVCT
jgi:hypothetical protein